MTEPRKHLVLIGLPGSGKSTVGYLIAATAGVQFVDVDVEIARHAGSSVREIFDGEGEARFRELESEFVRSFLALATPAVLAPGGGWAAQPGNLQALANRRVCVYLETSPEIAVARASQGEGRPLLPPGRELSAMEELLMNRERYYASADVRVITDDLSASEVAHRVAQLARLKGAL